MENTVNYAEKWSNELLAVIDNGTYTTPFIKPQESVKWLGAKVFHLTSLVTTGFKNHARGGGWNMGAFTQADHPFTIEHDRDIEFIVDKADVDESNQTATVQNISQNFTQTQATPEVDARFFERVYTAAHKVALESALTWTAANAYSQIKTLIQKKSLKKYRARGGLIAYVSSDVMDCLANSTEISKTLNIKSENLTNGGLGIVTRITEIDGVSIIEVVDDARFNTAFTYDGADGGFSASGKQINVCLCTPLTTFTVPKISSIYFFAPGQHTEGDGYLYQNRSMWDTFVLPNGLDGKVDSVWVDCAA